MSDPLVSVKIPTDDAGPKDTDVESSENGELYRDKTLVILTCLLVIAVLTIAYLAAAVILPLVLAFILKLLLQPGMRLLETIRIPRILSALLLILALFSVVVALGAAIIGPASAWAEKLPAGLPRLQERLQFLSRAITTLQSF